MDFYQRLSNQLELLDSIGNKRQLCPMPDNSLLNLSGNDYLGLSDCFELQIDFLHQLTEFARETTLFSSSSSRLLTGNHELFTALEQYLGELFQASALVFNSGFHMNVGIIPAISTPDTIIFSDELNHASIIDGIRLAKKGQLLKYPHNDIQALDALLSEHAKDYETCLIVTESIFSMDGDECPLTDLVVLKQKYPNILLYVDEAHAVGVRGNNGLGLASQYDCLSEIDLLVGTFSKALCSVGGYLICHQSIKEYLINHMRSFIFTTALPPINVAWTIFVLKHLSQWHEKRTHLDQMAGLLRAELASLGYQQLSSSHIVPVVMGDNHQVVQKSAQLLRAGFCVMPIRYPTVAKGRERLRISLHANVKQNDIERLLGNL